MRRRRQRPAPLPPAPPDPWLPLLTPAPDVPAPHEPTEPADDAPEALARADAAALVVGSLTDAHGRPVGLWASRRRRGAGDVQVVASAPIVVPKGWRRGDGPTVVILPADVAVDPPLDTGREPVLVGFDGPARTVVVVDLRTVGRLVVPAPWLVRAADAVLRAPLASGLDVVLCGVPTDALEPVAGSPARLHVAADDDDLEHLVRELAGGDEPLVVIAAAIDAAVLQRVGDAGAAVVTDGAFDAPTGARVITREGGGWRLDPPGWPVEAIRPA